MKTIAALLLCLCSLMGVAQKYDYTWITGYGSYEDNSDSITHGWKYGHSLFNFNESPVNISSDSLGMDIDATNTTISTSSGKLLFYTNGVWVANSLHEKIENSDSLNAGWLMFNFDPSIMEMGYRNPQGIIALPDFESESKFHLFHTYTDSVAPANVCATKVLHTELDMNENNGHGKVLSKNRVIYIGRVGQEVVATRHGNGRDWWMIVQDRNTACFKAILNSINGVNVLQDTFCTGVLIDDGEVSAATFSGDGSKYAFGSISKGLRIFNFDRCNGILDNDVYIPISSYIGGVCFSPNNRFLYVSAATIILQFDTWATDITALVDTIGIYDGYILNHTAIPGLFKTSQLAPDGKIYINCGSSTDVYHVINNPDEKGFACNFAQHSVKLSLNHSIPNFPNYRLGALPGSACDTLTSIKDIAEKEKILKVFPNPASDVATIDYGFTDWSKGEATLEIANALGQIVNKQALPMYSGFQKLDVSNYASGSYTVFIKRKAVVVATGRLVRE